MGYGLPHFLFSNHPLPIHFPFSPILFSLSIPSLHSSFTFIICIIFYLSLPHPLNPFSFAPSLPSIILPLLTILPLCPISPLAYLYCPSPPPLPFTPTPTTTILKISSPEMSSVLEHGIRSAPLLPPLLSPTHPTPSSPFPPFPLLCPPLLLTSTFPFPNHSYSEISSPEMKCFSTQGGGAALRGVPYFKIFSHILHHIMSRQICLNFIENSSYLPEIIRILE